LVPSDAVLATSAASPAEWDRLTLTANKVATLVTTSAGTQEFYLVDENQVACILTVATDRNLVSTLEARPLMWPLYLTHAIGRPQGDASNANLRIHASTFGVSFMVRPLGSWTSVTMPAPGPFTPESKTSPVAATLTPSTPIAPVPPAPRDESKWSWNDPNSSSTTTTPDSTALTIGSCGTTAAQGGAPDLHAFQVNPDLDPSYEFQAGFLMHLQQLDRWLDDLRANEKAIEPRPKTEKTK
jgi:hypothetical protein